MLKNHHHQIHMKNGQIMNKHNHVKLNKNMKNIMKEVKDYQQ